jgi:hypothetical protein
MATMFQKKFPVPLDILSRGFQASYRQDEINRCPGCGRSHWYVGRAIAECAFCSTAIPLAETEMLGVGLTRHVQTKKVALGAVFVLD